MKININFLKKNKNNSVFVNKYEEVNTNKYWNILIIVFFVIIIFGAIFGFIFFRKANSNLSVELNNTPRGNSFDKKEQIEKVLNYFEDKEKELENNLKYNQLIDPSL